MKKFKCWLFGHRLLNKVYNFYDFKDGQMSWVQECNRCKKPIFCIIGFVKTEPDYVCKIELTSTTMDELKHNEQIA